MIGYLRGWWDDYSDRYRDEHTFRQDKAPFYATRWRIAEWYDRHTPRCWSALAEFALGWTTTPGGNEEHTIKRCRESALKLGSCYCGKYVSEEAANVVPNLDQRIVVKTP